MSGLSASDAHSSGRKESLLSLSEGATHPPTTLKFPDGELDTWVCLGHITDQSVRVWLRAPSLTTAVASLKINNQPVAEAPLQPSADHDFVDALDIPLPQASGGCPFAVHVAGHCRQGFLPPPSHEPAAFSFVFGSCHQPFKATLDGRLVRQDRSRIYLGMREVLRAEDARFLLLLGDQIYSDGIPNLNVRSLTASGSLDPAYLTEYYRQLYRGHFNEAGFRSILELVPSYMIWDDHDILDNWGSFPQPNDFERSAFAAATRAYLAYQHLHNPGATLRDQPPFCYSFWYADVGFLVLDLRSQRDFDAGRVIGQEQWEKLESFLTEATECETRTIFVVVTIPVVHFPPAAVRLLDGMPGSKGENIRDRWDAENFRLQRDRLLHTLCDWQARERGRQVVILSGDVHSGAAFRVKRKHGPGEVLQWTSSPLSAPIGPGQLLVNNIGTALVTLGEKDFLVTREGVQARNNFGVVRVEPLSPREGMGHRISFILYKYQPSPRKVTACFRVSHLPQ
jgi:hypothetical protein